MLVRFKSVATGALILLFVLTGLEAYGWSIHPIIMKPALSEIPEVVLSLPVLATFLKQFLLRVENDLEVILRKNEHWLQQHLEWYPPLPEELEFRAGGDPDSIVQRFARAIRINPKINPGLYLQRLPGEKVDEAKRIPIEEITFLQDVNFWYAVSFERLMEGETVTALDVITTATDDPDFGLDVGLYENNHTEFGKHYGLGDQAFGNPSLQYGSQAPIHMGFHHESPIIYMAAGVLKQNLPEYRIRQCQVLARLAFDKGEDYWGWRFLGWGLHYMADLMQPYHSKALPGAGTMEMIWMNAKKMAGFDEEMNHTVQLASNRHSVFERFQQEELTKAYLNRNWDHPVFQVLRDLANPPEYSHRIIRNLISRESHDMADRVDAAVLKCVPANLVADPAFEFGDFEQQEAIVNIIETEKGDEAVAQLNAILGLTLKNLPAYSQSYIRSVSRQSAAAWLDPAEKPAW